MMLKPSILYKIKQCYAIAEKNNCDFMLHGGDVFNRPSIKEKRMKFSIV